MTPTVICMLMKRINYSSTFSQKIQVMRQAGLVYNYMFLMEPFIVYLFVCENTTLKLVHLQYVRHVIHVITHMIVIFILYSEYLGFILMHIVLSASKWQQVVNARKKFGNATMFDERFTLFSHKSLFTIIIRLIICVSESINDVFIIITTN